MQRLGLAILGCGWIARRHAAAACVLRRDVVLSFASRDPANAEFYRKRFGGAAAFGSYEAALRAPEVDAVVICTPHDRHEEAAVLAAAHGKHILVEKPIARRLEEADRMIQAAKAAGVALMVAENFRFMPAFRRVRRYLAEGWVGAVRQIQISAQGLGNPRGWRLDPGQMGGGVLIDGGIHYVDLLLQWGGEVKRLYALSPPKASSALSGEDTLSFLAQLTGGAVGFLSNSLAAPGMPRVQWSSISGGEGAVFVDHHGRFLYVRSRRGRRIHLFRKDRRGHTAMLREFVDAVRAERPPEMAGAEGRRDLAVVLAAYRSLATGKPVEVEP
ncbi:MAG: Gfo/Idh/MocA family oxidoreductase [candidate division NC10 bacterium]|mgnify:CR=1 FL=1